MHRMRGFTLIEVLIVVFIIAVLLMIVLMSFGPSSRQANDASLTADLLTLQREGITYFGAHDSYCASNNLGCSATYNTCTAANTMFSDPTTDLDIPIQNAITSANIHKAGGAVTCRLKKSAFVVVGQLSTTKWWCVDSTGSTSVKSSAPATGLTDCGYP